MNKLEIDQYTHDKLELARKTYGHKNQIMVCMEELCELACVLAKYPRYEDEKKAVSDLYQKAVDEVADVIIILEHVRSIFGISDIDLDARIMKKIDRLSRWLQHSDNMQETIDDRMVEEGGNKPTHTSCDGCVRQRLKTEQEFDSLCTHCYKAQATEGILPFYEARR